MKPIAVLYEHPEWFKPLFAELDRRGVLYDALHAAGHVYDPDERETPYGLVVNRMSPSAWRRGHGQAIFHTLHYLGYLEEIGANVLNGLTAFQMEISKARTDRAGDVYDGAGLPKGACAGMDVLGVTADRKDDLIRFTLTLDSAPSAAKAIACSPGTATGGIWGAEFGAATSESATVDKFNQFWIAYRDHPGPDPPAVYAGSVDDLNLTIQSMEFRITDPGSPTTPGGTCFTVTPPTPCTLVVSARGSDLGITPGNGLYSITGLSLYFFGTEDKPPLLRVELGNSEQADAAAPFHYLGSGTP